jgi:hypothetical protein
MQATRRHSKYVDPSTTLENVFLDYQHEMMVTQERAFE